MWILETGLTLVTGTQKGVVFKETPKCRCEYIF